MPGGDTYTIIYLKLMLISLEDNGKIYFEELAQDLAEEMALLIDEDTEAVRMTLMFLNKKGLLTRHSDYEFFLEQVPEMIGSETASTRRSRKHREQKVLQCNTNATKCNGDIDIDKEIELKKDINIDIKSEVDKKQTTADEKSDFNIFEYYQSRIGVLDGYQSQKLNDYIYIDNLSTELVKRAIDRAADNSKRNFGYINSILKNWSQNGIKTIAQQDEEQRNFEDNKASQNSYTQRPRQQKQTNVPDWWDKDYKHEATAEEQAKLDELRKSLMED